jgi:hypothetical protein
MDSDLRLRLHLHRLTDLCRRSARDDEIAFGCVAFTLRDLAYRANRVNDRSAGRIAHEPGKSFEVAGAFWVVRERQHIRLLRRQSGNGGLQDLHNALVESRDLRNRLCVLTGECELNRFCSGAEWLQILHSIALHGVRYIGNALRRLPK